MWLTCCDQPGPLHADDCGPRHRGEYNEAGDVNGWDTPPPRHRAGVPFPYRGQHR